jgi:tripartite-type tricarboxylate transporter receptor subunit TctC
LPSKQISILVQFSLNRHPELPDIPTAVDLARSDEERKILSAIMVAAEVGSAFFTTPGVPPDRLNALRRAFDATMQDKEFLADVERTRLTVSPMKGEDLQQLVKQVSELPPQLSDKVRQAYTANQH